MARSIVKNAGLYLVPDERIGEPSKIAADAYRDYPLHNWFTNGSYDPVASELIMKTTLAAMKDNAVIYADSEELNGFAVWAPQGFAGSKPLPFILNGGIRLLLRCGPGIIRRLLVYETFAMKLKKNYTGKDGWYLYNLSVRKSAQGHGMATRLMRLMLSFFDEENRLVYLETNKESNVTMYRHYGFELKKTNIVPGSSVRHFSMARVPVVKTEK